MELGDRRPPPNGLDDVELVVGTGGDLGKVGHHQHLMPAPDPRQCLPDRCRGLTAHPGIDLVVDDGGSVAAEYELSEVGWFRWDGLPSPLFKCLQNLVEKRGYPGT